MHPEPASTRPEPGATLGPYRILTATPTPETWIAHDSNLDRDVLLRFVPEGFSARFRREARAIVALNHPNIAGLFDIGPNYLVTELVDAPTLADRIAKGPLPLESALDIAKQIALALHAAHGQGILHRNLQSANIRIREDGSVKVMELGLTQSPGDHFATTPDTQTRTMAMPEPFGRGADIRAFGIILYEMVTGRKPSTDTMTTLGAEPEWDHAPAGVRRLLRACLTEDPALRLQDLGAIDWPARQNRDDDEPEPTAHAWGPFLLIERVGRGGFGEVYRARDFKLDREVAVKLLRTTAGDDSDYTAILREARLIAKVRHPNVVSVYGVERYDGRVGFWSDFVNGKTLADLQRIQGPFGARETAAIGIELCRALSAMHSAGLLHRDIKASNVMREQGGRILLMDFGLSADMTGGGASGGTPQYMAPELFKGSPASVATDIYAMGVLLFFLTTGRYPVDSIRAAGVRRRLIDERPDLPETFTTAVETAIDPDPAKRFASAGEMLAALSNTVGSNPAKPVRKRWQLAVAAALLLAGLAGIGYRIYASGHHAPAGANQYYVDAEALLQREDKPGNVDKAIELYNKAITDDPKFALAHSGLARAYVLKYSATHSADFLEKADADGQLGLQLDAGLAPVHVTMGVIYTKKNRYDLAANELQEAISLDGTSAEAYAARAKLYAAQGRANDVVTDFLKAIQLSPDDWRWPNQFGAYYLSTGKYAEATDQFLSVVKLASDNSYGFINLGIAYRRLERFPEAEAALKQALKLDSHSTFALNTYGNLLMSERKYAEAVPVYRQAINLAPDDYQIRSNLASAYQWSGMKDQAHTEYLAVIDMAEKLRMVEPRDPTLLADLGAYYAAVGNQAKALPLLRQALALSPEDPNILIRAGEGFELSGQRKEAIASIGKALDLGYSSKYVERSPELVDLRKDPKFLAREPQVR